MPKVNLLNAQAIDGLVELVNQDRLSEAEHNARTLLITHPNVGMLWKILSVALLRQGKDALPALRQTTELMADDAEAHRNLGAALCEQGQWALGLESFRRALALAPLDADCLVEAAGAPAARRPAWERWVALARPCRSISGRCRKIPGSSRPTITWGMPTWNSRDLRTP